MPTLPSGTADAVLDALPHPVIMVSADGRVANANAAAESFFEASLPLLRRHRLGDLVPFGSPLLALIDQVRARGAAVNEYKVDLGTPRNPGERLVDLHVAPLPERPDHVVVMLQERTIADKMDRQLTHRGAARSVTALAAMLAHEIKNPLSGIRGAAQLLERELDRPPLIEYTQVIIGEADRLQSLVNRLLTPHRLPTYRRSNIHEILVRVKGVVQAEFPHVSFNLDFDASLPEFDADSEQLQQAVLNIVRNAAQALSGTTADPRIRMVTRVARYVTLARRRHRLALALSIEDNGPGIPESIRDRIFYPLVSGREGGTGLGLTLAQTFIAQHGGTIECESRLGRTVFSILLPLELSRNASKT
jgi:two-component system nitrogen regulation sensor histidine kinase GlnL